MSCPFETFSDEEITVRLSVPLIVDALWANEYKTEVPLTTREVGRSLMYLVRKYGTVIPHSLLLQAVAEHTELCESTVGPFIENAVDLKMITALTPAEDTRQRLYGFIGDQKKKILRATNIAYASALALEQSKDPSNVTHGKTPQNASYYRHIFDRINTPNEALMKKVTKLRQKIGWVILAAMGIALMMQPWAEALASWSTGTTLK